MRNKDKINFLSADHLEEQASIFVSLVNGTMRRILP